MVLTEMPRAIVRTDEKAFRELYEQAFPLVAQFVARQGGTFQDAKDIFHDALVIFCEKTAEKKVTIRASEEAYVLGIAKHLWLRKFKKDRGTVPIDGLEHDISIPEDYFGTGQDNRLVAVLERTGKKCMELLQAFYYDKRPLKDIARTGGYAGVRSATVQKFKCLEKVRDLVKQKAMTYEDLSA